MMYNTETSADRKVVLDYFALPKTQNNSNNMERDAVRLDVCLKQTESKKKKKKKECRKCKENSPQEKQTKQKFEVISLSLVAEGKNDLDSSCRHVFA